MVKDEENRKRSLSPSKEELKIKVEDQKKKIKNLQQQMLRENKKAKTLAEVIHDIKSTALNMLSVIRELLLIVRILPAHVEWNLIGS